MNKGSVLLEIDQLCVAFHQSACVTQAVDGLSFALKKGESLGIVGESGSGKSVTALSIMGLLPGSASLEGTLAMSYRDREGQEWDLLRLDPSGWQRLRGREIGMIFQEPGTALNPVWRCGNQVAEVMRRHLGCSPKLAKAQTLEWFERVLLPQPDRMFQAYPHELSGGQKQRVMIAMAMCCQPQLLIADEPTTALDVTVQQTILQLIRDLQQEFKMATLFISHDLGVIAQVADQLLIMQSGKEVESGLTPDIFGHPQQSYTRALMACRPPLDRRLKRLPVLADFSGNKPGKPEKSEVEAPKNSGAEPESILEVKELSTWFSVPSASIFKRKGYVKAVDDATFSVFKGETLGLVGESGSGKTTLGKTLLGLVQAKKGQVWFNGRELMRLEEPDWKTLRKDMQIIFQDPFSSLNPRMRAGQAIMEPMQVHRIGADASERKAMALDLLEKVGLEAGHFDRFPHEFSGGQRQRLAIARALALGPRFIVCDESVSSLDVSIQAQVLNLLKDLQDQYGLTYIFISHDLSVIRFMSERIIVMKDGHIVESGLAEEVYRHPRHPYTRQLIASIPEIEHIRGND